MKIVNALIILVLLAAGCGRKPDAAHEFQRGVAYFQEQKFGKAAAHFERSLSQVATNAQALNFLGVCQLHDDQPAAAVASLQRALSINPNYTTARYNLGLAQLELDHTQEAIAELRQVARASDAPADTAYHLGLAYIRASAWSQADQSLTQYARTTNSVEALHQLGLVNVRLHDYQAAHRHLSRAIEIAPDYAPAYLNLAVIEQTYLKQNSDATAHYQKYLQLAPKSEHRDAVRQALAKLTEPPPAPVAVVTPKPAPPPPPTPVEPPKPTPAPVVEKITPPPAPPPPPPVAVVTPEPVKKTRPPISTAPLRSGSRNRATAYFNKGVQQQQRNNLAAAISAYQDAIQADASFATAYYNLAICYRTANQPDKALDNYELALRANPDYTDARFNYAILLHEQGYTDDAIAQYERIVTANPNDAAAHLSLATIYAQNKATIAKARDQYQTYIRLAPNSPLARDIRRWLEQNR